MSFHLPIPSNPSERLLCTVVEELKLLIGEVSGLRGDVKALRDAVLAPKTPVVVTTSSSLEAEPAKQEPPRSGSRPEWGKVSGRKR